MSVNVVVNETGEAVVVIGADVEGAANAAAASASAAETSKNQAIAAESGAQASESAAEQFRDQAEGFANNAQSSASAAASSESSAQNSASAAATSESNAQASEQAAAQSATDADNSAQAAASSESAALASEQAAMQSEQAAMQSEQAASQSESNAAASAQAASASEQNALNSEQAAATSETNALASEQNASQSESAAATSASAASQSESAASSSAQAAAASESNAATSESNALASEQAASQSEQNAASSEQAASSSASAAASSAQAAATSEQNALASEQAASASESNALASEQAAAQSQSQAAGSAQAAQTAETGAQTAQTAAESARDQTQDLFTQFGDQYLGPHPSNPTTDNSGNALTIGDVYFNTSENVLKFYSGTAWVSPEKVSSASAAAALASEQAASQSETNAGQSAAAALASEQTAEGYRDQAESFKDQAAASETAAGNSEQAAATSESNALSSEQAADQSAQNAASSESNAQSSAQAAAQSESSADSSAQAAASSASAAASSESNAATSESNAQTSEQAADQSAQDAAISESNAQASASTASSAKDDAETARDQAQAAKTASETAQGLSESARDASEGFKDQAETARDAAQGARDTALTHRNEAEGFRDGAEGFAQAAESSAQSAASSASAAASSESAAASSASAADSAKDAAETAQSAAETAETNAQGHENKAEQWAQNPEDVEVENGEFSAKHWAAKALANSTGITSTDQLAEGSTNLYFTNQRAKDAVDAADVGLGNVDNTSDADKPISTATQSALNLKADSASLGSAAAADTGDFDPAGSASSVQSNLTTHIDDATNPHNVTATQVGLGNVDNTADLDKPISTAAQSALDDKADKTTQVIAGTGLDGGGNLSENRTLDLDSATVASLGKADTALQPSDNVSELTNDANYINAAGAPVQSVNTKTGTVTLDAADVGADPSGSAAGVQSNLTAHINDNTNPHSVTKAQVGLGNVTNDAQFKLADAGTAATANVTTSATDTTAGRLLKVGDFGVGTDTIIDFETIFADSAEGRTVNITRPVPVTQSSTVPEKVLLIGKVAPDSLTNNFMGRYTLFRSASGGNNVSNIMFDVSYWSGSSNSDMNFWGFQTSRGASGLARSKGITCDYQGHRWYGIQITVNRSVNGGYFTGLIDRNGRWESIVVNVDEVDNIEEHNADFENLHEAGGYGFQIGNRSIFHQANILGTVSQSAGVPTGAVIERGSNANGEFVRFADGTQICWSPDFQIDATDTSGALFYTDSSDAPQWEYPANFSSEPHVSTMKGDSISVYWTNTRQISSNSCRLRVISAVERTSPLPVRAVAIGRWFE